MVVTLIKAVTNIIKYFFKLNDYWFIIKRIVFWYKINEEIPIAILYYQIKIEIKSFFLINFWI